MVIYEYFLTCSKCWNVAKRLRRWFLIPTFEGSNPSIPDAPIYVKTAWLSSFLKTSKWSYNKLELMKNFTKKNDVLVIPNHNGNTVMIKRDSDWFVDMTQLGKDIKNRGVNGNSITNVSLKYLKGLNKNR